MTILQNSETPPHPPPPFLDTPDFSDKDFSDWLRPPRPLLAKNSEKFSVFSDKIPPFWQNMPKNLIFSDKTILDWVRPPPYAKKISVFSDKEISDFPRPPRPPFGE